MSLLVNHFRFRPWPNARNIIRTGVFGNSVLVPAQVQDDAVIGSSGDARIVRCQAKADGSGTYWAETKPGEIAFAGLRRVAAMWDSTWNTKPEDPTTWQYTQSPLYVGSDGIEYGRLTFSSRLERVRYTPSMSGPENIKQAARVWIRPIDVPSGALIALNCRRVSGGIYISDSFLAANLNKWLAFGIGGQHNEPGLTDYGLQMQRADDNGGNLTIDIAVGNMAPAWYWYTDEIQEHIVGHLDYGFGAPGVAYFAYENPFSVDNNGVVTDTGQRTPLVGGGLVAAKAETNVVSPSHTTSTEGWTLDTSASWQGAGTALPRLPAPEGFKGDGVDTSVNADNSGSLSTALNDKLYMHAVAEVVGGATGEDSECSIRDTSGTALAQVYLRKGTGPVYSGGFVYSDYQAAAGPNGGDLYEFIIEATETASSSTRVFRCYSDAGVASQKVLYLHHAYLGKERPSPYLLLHSSSGTAAVSRVADDVPIDIRASVQARAVVTLDLSAGIIAGPVFSGEKTDGSKFDMLVLNSNGTLTITDPGGATYTTTNAVSAAINQEIRFDADTSGLTIRINGNEETSTTAFDFSSMVRVRPGHRPDTNTAVGIPFTTIHWGVF